MTEKDLKDALVRTIRDVIPAAVVFRHEDKNTAGIPDISVTYRNLTIWFEPKYANPYVHSRGLQMVTCARLAKQGLCYLVIYEEKKEVRKTWIVEPKTRIEELFIDTPDECVTTGFNHDFVVMFIRRLTGDYEQ